MRAEILTVIVFIYIFAVAVKGTVKGFYRSVISILFLIALFFMTIVLSPKTYDVIRDSRNVNEYLEEKAWNIVGAETEEIAAGKQYTLLQNIPVSDELAAALRNGDSDIIQSDSIQIYLKNEVKKFLMYATAAIFTLVFSGVILIILAVILHGIVETPGIRMIDRVMGFLLGLLEGLFGVWLLLSLLHLFEFTDTAGYILRHVDASPLLSVLDDYNLIYLAERYVMGMKIWN